MTPEAGRPRPQIQRRRKGARIWRRRLLAVALVAIALGAGYVFWFRDSSLVAVNEVEVSGATADRAEITAALVAASSGMSTLNVDRAALEASVAGFPTVGSIEVGTSFPHKLEITIDERLPVATARRAGKSAPVSADGYLLTGVDYDPDKLPSLQLLDIPKADRLGRRDREQSELLAALPPEFSEGVDRSHFDTELDGVVVELDNGIELRMGDSTRAAAKWAAAASVLADPQLGSPAYIDVSVPDRPVSGGFSS